MGRKSETDISVCQLRLLEGEGGEGVEGVPLEVAAGFGAVEG